MSGIPIKHCNIPNAKIDIQQVAYQGFYYAAPISIPVCCTTHWEFNSGTKGLILLHSAVLGGAEG